MKYRHKPVVIEAVQWDGVNIEPLWKLALGATKRQPFTLDGAGHTMIHTLEGVVAASPGNWIIKGTKGEFYPVADEIFRAIYEPIEEEK